MPIDNRNNALGAVEVLNKFTIPNRLLYRKRHKWNSTEEGTTLSQVKDMLATQRENMNVVDFAYAPNKCKVSFNENNVPFIQFHKGFDKGLAVWSSPCAFTKRGWNALMGFICPSNMRGWENLVGIGGEASPKVASMGLNLFMQNHSNKLLFRTALTKVKVWRKVNGKNVSSEHIVRVIRSIQADSKNGYTAIDNFTLVNQLIRNHSLQAAKILEVQIEDNSFMLRSALMDVNGKMELNNHYPMIQIGNSETGQGSVKIVGGEIRPWCDNGCYSTNKKSQISFAHRGEEDRIINGVNDRFDTVIEVAQGTVDLFNKAQLVEVNDLHAQMEQQFATLGTKRTSHKLNEKEKDSVYKAMGDKTSSPHNLLAAGADAITFAAKALPLNRRWDLEQLAFDYLQASLETAVNNKIVVEIPS